MKKTKNNKDYVLGYLTSGVKVPFKVWDNSAAFNSLKNYDYEGVIAYITAQVDEYGGQTSLILSQINAVEGYSEDQFLSTKYNIEAYWDGLRNMLAQNVSAHAMNVCDKILFNNSDISVRFKLEFAASTHHDNCKGGLLAHTYKVVRLVSVLMNQYKSLFDEQHKDLLFLAALLHDVGKLREYKLGSYVKPSYADHLLYSVEMVSAFKADILAEGYTEDWFNQFIAAILEHHGEYGMKCRTVDAYILNMADMMESRMTMLQQYTEDLDRGQSFKMDDCYLTY